MEKRKRKEELGVTFGPSHSGGLGGRFSWGRVLPPGPRHSRAMQVGEEVERGAWHFMPALMAL